MYTANIEREMHHLKNMFKNDACSTTEIKVPCTKEKARSFGIPTNWHSYHIIQHTVSERNQPTPGQVQRKDNTLARKENQPYSKTGEGQSGV
jgi:hypothetical protein